jgi:hypothetical protein
MGVAGIVDGSTAANALEANTIETAQARTVLNKRFFMRYTPPIDFFTFTYS